MMGFGFVMARFGLFLREIAATGRVLETHSAGLSLWIGTALVLLGVIVNALAALQHYRFLRRPCWSLGVAVAVTLTALGAGMAAYLLVGL